MHGRTVRRMVATAAAVVIVLLPTAAFGSSHCQRVHGTGLTFQNLPFGPFEGTASLNLGEADVLVVLVAPPEEKPDGTLHIWTSHAFSFVEEGGFVTIDRGVLAPTETPGLYNLNTRAKICASPDCAGEMVNGVAPCGRLSVTGTIDFGALPPEAHWRVRGRICDCGEE